VCCPLLWLCRPFRYFERCLDSNPESCRSKQARYQFSHPSPIGYVVGRVRAYVYMLNKKLHFTRKDTHWHNFRQGCGSESGSGSTWIPIEFGWLDSVPHPGGRKWPTKIEKSEEFCVSKYWMFSLRLRLWLRLSSRRPKGKNCQFFTLKIIIFQH
jgi:hypothetical protein